MEDLKSLIDILVTIMKIPFEIWGFTLSMWEVMLALLIGGVIIELIVRFFDE